MGGWGREFHNSVAGEGRPPVAKGQKGQARAFCKAPLGAAWSLVHMHSAHMVTAAGPTWAGTSGSIPSTSIQV